MPILKIFQLLTTLKKCIRFRDGDGDNDEGVGGGRGRRPKWGVGLAREACSGILSDIKYSSNVKLTTEYCTICQQIV